MPVRICCCMTPSSCGTYRQKFPLDVWRSCRGSDCWPLEWGGEASTSMAVMEKHTKHSWGCACTHGLQLFRVWMDFLVTDLYDILWQRHTSNILTLIDFLYEILCLNGRRNIYCFINNLFIECCMYFLGLSSFRIVTLTYFFLVSCNLSKGVREHWAGHRSSTNLLPWDP